MKIDLLLNEKYFQYGCNKSEVNKNSIQIRPILKNILLFINRQQFYLPWETNDHLSSAFCKSTTLTEDTSIDSQIKLLKHFDSVFFIGKG